MAKASVKRNRIASEQLVLRTIYSTGQISRADIARATKLTPPTVSELVGKLLADGLIEEKGLAPSSSGRRGILLDVVDNSRQIIGIDLSREDFRGALTDLRGRTVHRVDLSLDGRDGEEALSLVYDLVNQLIASATKPILGIGIGAPGLIDPFDGILQQAVNLNWRYIPIRSLLYDRNNLPVYMANDCQLAALAEFTFGEDNGPQNDLPLVVIKLGWGVGAGIIVDGKLLHGSRVGTGEIGHVRVVDNGIQCACGNYGCLETVASIPAIMKQIKLSMNNDPNSSFHKFVKDQKELNTNIVVWALENGNNDMSKIIDGVGEALGIAASNLVGVLGSCHIMIHCSITCSYPLLIEKIRETLIQRTLPSLARATKLSSTSLGSDNVICGASALVLHHELAVL
jgi:predicted NBD/HSP70 family sugar kinase